MKKFNITAEDILKVVTCILLSFGIYTCGWINGHLSASDLIDRDKRDVEYVYIEVEKDEKADASEDDAQNASIEPVEAPEWPKLYSDEDAVALAQTLYGEARGVKELTNDGGFTVSGTCQKAAVAWCVLNRYDAGYEDSIVEVCAAEGQFIGYESDNPVWNDLLELAYDVLDRWNAEKHGETNVGRVIPSDYFWFRGDGQYNWFRNEYRGREHWDWTLGDPYVE
jgi:hypothetical protein